MLDFYIRITDLFSYSFFILFNSREWLPTYELFINLNLTLPITYRLMLPAYLIREVGHLTY